MLSFIIFTVVGTLSHELGHIAVAKILGYETHLGYGYMNFDKTGNTNRTDNLLILIGGPLQTMLTGTTGLALLFCYRKRFSNRSHLSTAQWLLILVTLFWLRQSTNMIMSIPALLNGTISGSDEPRIAWMLHWPPTSIAIITGLLPLVIPGIVLFRFIPALQRITFLVAGLVGGSAGYWLWLIKSGPLIMP